MGETHVLAKIPDNEPANKWINGGGYCDYIYL